MRSAHLDIAEYTDPHHDPMISHTWVLEPGLRGTKSTTATCSSAGLPWRSCASDLRAVLQRCRPDWDIGSAEQRAAWAKGEKTGFYPYGKTQVQVLAELD